VTRLFLIAATEGRRQVRRPGPRKGRHRSRPDERDRFAFCWNRRFPDVRMNEGEEDRFSQNPFSMPNLKRRGIPRARPEGTNEKNPRPQERSSTYDIVSTASSCRLEPSAKTPPRSDEEGVRHRGIRRERARKKFGGMRRALSLGARPTRHRTVVDASCDAVCPRWKNLREVVLFR